jgi:1,4-dihydroxy-2-naphthoate octaprenyltransferase
MFYQLTGSKTAEFITILHPYYTAMSLSFLAIGFGIAGVQRWDVFAWIMLAYFLGLGIAAHAFDQLPGMGSNYVKYLTPKDLMRMGVAAVSAAVMIGIFWMVKLAAWHLLWIIPLQTFFVMAYPYAKFAKGFFHNDFFFAFSFGFVPVMAGYYINTLTLNPEFIPWAVVAAIISGIEITLSRYVRKWRRNVYLLQEPSVIDKPELALKLLCILSYLLAVIFIMR